VKRTIIRRPEVEKRTGLTCSGIYEAMSRGEFPKSVPIGRYAVGWIEDEVNAWIEARIEARESKDVKPLRRKFEKKKQAA
jgi:prophage regulatory protein